MPGLRIAFAGTPDFALPALLALLDSPHSLVGVLTQPDRPSGRGRKLTASPVKRAVLERGLPVSQPGTLRSEAGRADFMAWRPDALVVVAYGLLLPAEVLSLPRFGCVNIHASLLPRWRGAAPIQRAILAGDSQTGITIMQMDTGLDTGPVLLQRAVPIEPADTAGSLHDRLAPIGASMLLEALADLEAGRVHPQDQPSEGVTYAAKIDKAEAVIAWDSDARQIERMIRAFNPRPIAETVFGGESLRIHSAHLAPLATNSSFEPLIDSPEIQCGEILSVTRDAIHVRCGRGELAITQRAAARSPSGFGRGFRSVLQQCRATVRLAGSSMAGNKTHWAPGAAALADAARAVAAIVFAGNTSDVALAPFAAAADRAAVRAIALGCVRWYLRLAPVIESLLPRPDGVAHEIRALLTATAHQIEYSRNPAETNANAAVDAARILGHPRATGLVNAVLRRFVADRSDLLARADIDLATRTAHPQWMVQAFESAWPDEFESVLEANNGHPPMHLRVNLSRTSVTEYLSELADTGIDARAVDWAPSAVQLERPVGVFSLPGFKEGRVSVQDAGAQLAAELLDAQNGMRVLDACAAPGGKTGHLLERTPHFESLLVVDIDAERMGRIRDNLKRIGRPAQLIAADIRDPESFWDGRPFERILLDAPCSSTGVIRRHPDIKLLRRDTDIPKLAETQLAVLKACFSMLAAGGGCFTHLFRAAVGE